MSLRIVDSESEFERLNEEEAQESESLGPNLGPCPEPPDWMGFEAKLEWLRSAPVLHEEGKLKGGIISLLENYCVNIGDAREYCVMVQNDGKVVNGKLHPAIKAMNEAMRDARAVGAILFVTPGGKRDTSEAEIEAGKMAKAAAWGKDLLA